MTTNLDRVPKNLRLLRASRQISQEELAGTIHLTRTTYCCYENGTRKPDLQTLDALAAFYEISFDSLVNYDLSEGILNKIYFNDDNKELAELLTAYQSLSLSSRFLVSQRLDALLEKENALYAGRLSRCQDIRKQFY